MIFRLSDSFWTSSGVDDDPLGIVAERSLSPRVTPVVYTYS